MGLKRRISELETADAANIPEALPKSVAFQLSSIDVKKLDFDKEKICSVTLSPLNVYCCLICGRYLQGRGENSVAFLHSIHKDHHVFANLQTSRIYLLPENAEVADAPILRRIQFAISPSYTKAELDSYPKRCLDAMKNSYLNGFVGLIEPKNTSHFAAIVQLLAHISPLKDSLALKAYNEDCSDEVVKRFAILVKKIWSPHLFRAHVSPHEFLNQLSVAYKPSSSDPKNFLLWMLNRLNSSDPALRKLLTRNLRGEISRKTTIIREESKEGSERSTTFVRDEDSTSTQKIRYLCLTLNLPPMPLFADGFDTNSIPQIDIESLLGKFMGTGETHTKEGIQSYSFLTLPKFLLLHVDRFKRNDDLPVKNRNQTLVKFPDTLRLENKQFKLVANVLHSAVRGKYVENEEVDDVSEWKIQVLDSKRQEWYEIEGKKVTAKQKELLFLGESYLQVWEALE
ncbi:LAFA_0A04632g1_1 [Lachancea sp. 'fantastica']|nr:LAFA_0A04632g1_1 [Lachancea sp. 'fantastica']